MIRSRNSSSDPRRWLVAHPSVVDVHAVRPAADRRSRAARAGPRIEGFVRVATTIGGLAGLVQKLRLLRSVTSSPLSPALTPIRPPSPSFVKCMRPSSVPSISTSDSGRRTPWIPFHRRLVSVDRYRRHPGDGAVRVAGGGRHRHRDGTGDRLGGIPRTERRAGMGLPDTTTPILYIAWSIWLVAIGIALIV